MITVKEVENLANLARIRIEDEEKQALTKEIDSILTYIDQIKQTTVNMDYTPIPGVVHNVYRDDIALSSDREQIESILDESPDREGNFIAVKKIIEQD